MSGFLSAVERLAALATGIPSFRVWTSVNEVSSDGNTNLIPAIDLEPGAQNPVSRFVHITGATPTLGGVFAHEPFTPNYPQDHVTQDPFDQVQAFFALTKVFHLLEKIGFDVQSILGSLHEGKFHAVQAAVNAFAELNAYFSLDEDRIAFGTANEKWHLGSDWDVVVHEFGHMLLHHINPMLGGWGNHEGGAIHEAFGDALAALVFDDAEMSEDFVRQLGRTPSKNDGLRIVKNNLKLSDAGEEVHDRGRVYAGFFWSLYEILQKKFELQTEEAQIAALKILVNHAFHYKSSSPKPNDFVDAVIEGVKSLEKIRKLNLPQDTLIEAIEAEATKRELRTPQEPQPKPQRREAPQFRLLNTAPFIGGITTLYQQQYQTSGFGAVDVVGHGWQSRKLYGSNRETFVDDLRFVKAGSIDESKKIPFNEALESVRQKLRNDLQTAQNSLNLIEIAFQQKKKRRNRLTARQIFDWKKTKDAVFTLEKCHEVLQKGDNRQPAYVVFDEDNVLSYAISLAYGTFYVNTHTGEIRFEKKIFF